MELTISERQLGRIEAALWGIEEATKNNNFTAARLAKVIKEQIDEAEEAAQSRGEEDLREDLALQLKENMTPQHKENLLEYLARQRDPLPDPRPECGQARGRNRGAVFLPA